MSSFVVVQLLSCVWLFETPRTIAARLLCPWDSSGKSPGVGCQSLLQGIFLTQGLNPGLLKLQVDSLLSEPPEKPGKMAARWQVFFSFLSSLRAHWLTSVAVVQSLSHVWLCPWTAARQASLSFTISQCLLKLMSVESMMTFNHLILCPPASPPALSLSQHHGLFQWVGSSHQVAKALKLQFQHQSFQGIFRVNFLYNWLVWSPC